MNDPLPRGPIVAPRSALVPNTTPIEGSPATAAAYTPDYAVESQRAAPEGDSTGGGTYEQFTICDSGSPATRWWLTYTSNPRP